jgi:3',5'-cyclic-AMP phosphodiesterase
MLMGINTHESLKSVLTQLKQVNPAPTAIVMTGDLAQDGTIEAYKTLVDLMVDFPGLIAWVPGNHDDYDAMRQVLASPAFVGPSGGEGGEDRSSHAPVSLGLWRLILLNSVVEEQVYGRLTTASLAALDRQLAATAPHPTIVALHHPPGSVNAAWLDAICLQQPEAFWNVLDRYAHVKLVLCGHIHQDYSDRHHGVTYYTTPSTCFQFSPRQDQFGLDPVAPGFRILDLFADGHWATEVLRVPVPQSLDLMAQGY